MLRRFAKESVSPTLDVDLLRGAVVDLRGRKHWDYATVDFARIAQRWLRLLDPERRGDEAMPRPREVDTSHWYSDASSASEASSDDEEESSVPVRTRRKTDANDTADSRLNREARRREEERRTTTTFTPSSGGGGGGRRRGGGRDVGERLRRLDRRRYEEAMELLALAHPHFEEEWRNVDLWQRELGYREEDKGPRRGPM